MNKSSNAPVKVLLTEAEINARLDEIAAEITRDYDGKTLTLICILKGAIIFMVDLARKIGNNVRVEYDFMDISSYGSGKESSGVIKINKDLSEPLSGKDVLIIEDIIDSGRTLSYLIKYLGMQNPKSLRVCTLLDKPDRRVNFEVIPNYTGFVIPDEFVIGYGLDFNQQYRNLKYIGVLTEENRRQ